MQPGQLQANAFEVSLLERVLVENAMPFAIADLDVLSREITGVGSFTNFRVKHHPPAPRRILGIAAAIKMPGVENGLGVVAFDEGDRLVLELFTYGNETWDGEFNGFEIE